MGFVTGVACVGRGVGRLVTTPRLWAYAVGPVLVASVLFVGLATSFQRLAAGRVAAWAHELTGDGRWADWATSVLVWFLAALAAFFVFSSAVRVVAAPFLALLADRVVADVSGMPTPAAPGGHFLRWVVRPLFETLLVFGIRIAITLAALPFFLIPAAGGLLFSGVMMALVGLDLLDVALSARAVPLRERLRFVRGQVGATLGLGLGAGFLLMIPCVNVLLLPAAVVAAVLLDQALSPDFPRVAPVTA